MTSSLVKPLIDLIQALRDDNEDAVESILRDADSDYSPELFAALIRSSIFHGGASPRYYRKIRNIWVQRGRPALKRVQLSIEIEILSDATVDALAPHLELFLAPFGVDAKIALGAYDSVEHEAFVASPKSPDVTIVLLSEQWLRKHMPLSSVSQQQFDGAADQIQRIVTNLSAKRSGLLVFTSFYQGAWPVVAGLAYMGEQIPWAAAIQGLNQKLLALAHSKFMIADAQSALHAVGGASAAGKLATTRMHAPFEASGFISVARELASIIAHAFGKAHRALLTDWDNTIWGGEVGELGFEGIQCGQETADSYGYYLLQCYMRDLTGLGVLIAAISRNDPSMANVLEANPALALRREHFASLNLSWGDKSISVQQAIADLNFGADLMVYIDDNHVDLAEVLMAYPEIDIVLAGPDPDQSLTRLSLGRYFNAARLTHGDLTRTGQAAALREQRSVAKHADSREAFLASLDINITVSELNNGNMERVLQLLQKTNQFNLTTRRHRESNLLQLADEGARFGVFSYADRFGAQGIIGLMILVPLYGKSGYEIDTWLMSCRVLNRGVEESMLDWAASMADGGEILGRYNRTEKNGLVSDLYLRLGFRENASEVGSYSLKPTNKSRYQS